MRPKFEILIFIPLPIEDLRNIHCMGFTHTTDHTLSLNIIIVLKMSLQLLQLLKPNVKLWDVC